MQLMGLARLAIDISTEERGRGKTQYYEVVLTLIEAVSLVRGNEIINQIQTAVTADHHPCGAILQISGSWLQMQWLAQWHFKTYLILALVLLL